MAIRVLALDLERTLVSDAWSRVPRPGLREFLDFCHERFERVALFTCVERADAWEILGQLTGFTATTPRLTFERDATTGMAGVDSRSPCGRLAID